MAPSIKRPTALLRSFNGGGRAGLAFSTTAATKSFGSTLSAADAAKLVAEEFEQEEAEGKTAEPDSIDSILMNDSKHSSSSSAIISRSSDDEEDDHDDDDEDEDEDVSDTNLDESHSSNDDGPSPLSEIIAQLGRNPSPEQLARVAGQRAEEQLDKCLGSSSSASVICHEKFTALSQYSKSDLIIRGHLGKGSFSDAFEVTLVIKDDESRPMLERSNAERELTSESLCNDADDLDAIFANLETKFSGIPVTAGRNSSSIAPPSSARGAVGPRRNPSHRRSSLNASICVGSLQSTAPGSSVVARRHNERTLTLAMKCLRPQIRSNPEQFLIGVEDLVHETAILASLDHPNIVKLHGRASGNDLTTAFRLDDGYFILLDRLKDTLEERIDRWKNQGGGRKKSQPSVAQLKTACAIADAMAYLHSKNICFRDLKPNNVGYDSAGVLKLFDFGFAVGISPPDPDNEEDDGLLYDKCGTPRYMAPEVGLMEGYALEADVYSFGIILWEICALKKPFAKIKSAKEFHKSVFVKGERPKIGKHWPSNLKDLMQSCWATDPKERPSMDFVKTMMSAMVREASNGAGQGDQSLRKSKMFKRLTWDL